MITAEDLASRLPYLIDELRDAGYAIGVEQYIAAEDLVLALAARGGLPADPGRYRTLLGPIFCKSPRQQDDFRARFDHWIAQDPPASPQESARSLERELSALEQGARAWRRIFVTGAAAALLLAAVALLVLMRSGQPAQPQPTQPIAKRAATESESPAPNPPSPGPGTQRGVSLETFVLPVLGLLVVAFPAWRFWWGYRARLFLTRRTTSEAPDLARVAVKTARGELFRDFSLAQMAQRLRQRRTVASERLDVAATIQSTVRKGGWLTLVPGKSRVLPEYLVLVDRASQDDHQARFFAELIAGLAQAEVLVARYDFDGDPRICHPAAPALGRRVATIRDLVTCHPEDRLLIVSSGAGLIDPLTGEVVRWADQFARWSERALLTPEPTDSWGYRELILARHGFLVLPATEEGIAALADPFRAGAEEPAASASAPYPPLLRERPRRWLEQRAPGPDVLAALLGELRRYLGEDGSIWLAACAVYPALHWELTLDLGCNLRTAADLRLLDPTRLAALARLPWFRHGAMPDWLWVALIGSLPRDRERAIRASLQALLLTASQSQGPVEGLDLEIARQHGKVLDRLAKPIFRTLRRQAPDDSPLHDHVFATFMAGRRPGPQALELPAKLGALIGVRPNLAIPLLLAVLLLASAGGLLVGLRRRADQPAVITNTIGMKLVLIPAGEFLMGSPASDKEAHDDEKPQHRVRITQPFYLGVTEVTQGQYRAITGENPSDFKGSDGLPVESVSWNEAIAFCNKLSAREGLKPYYQFGAGVPSGGEGYRLPTEAEWEYACRAGATTRFSFGDADASLGEYAWFGGNSGSETHPVGQKRPNAWGLFDMHGNVWEWCWDRYDEKYYASSPGADPLGPSGAVDRVIRGGCWYRDPQQCRAAYRYGYTPGYRFNNLGFRVARVSFGNIAASGMTAFRGLDLSDPGSPARQAFDWYCAKHDNDLRKADLRGAVMTGMTLKELNLDGADLEGAKLNNVTFDGGSARGVVFKGAQIYNGNLRKGTFSGANFDRADIRHARGRGADFSGARFVGALTDAYTDF
jgi:formylglycine-generating enzyme required for sulfatase activity